MNEKNNSKVKQAKKSWDGIEKFAFDMWEPRLKVSSILQDLPADAQKDWNTMSFKTLDRFLKKHHKEITCGDVSAIYWKFWWDLKKLKSNSTNFMGYSELLTTRLLLHLLKSEYFTDDNVDCYSTPNPDSPLDDLGYFELSSRSMALATEIIPQPFKDGLGNRRPDIILYNGAKKRIYGVVQVKSYPASAESVKTDLKFINKLKTTYKDVRGLVLIFYGCKTLFNSDKQVCKLADSDLRIADVFRDRLELDRLKTK